MDQGKILMMTTSVSFIQELLPVPNNGLLAILATAVAVISFHFWQNQRYYAKLGNQIPGPPALPIIGHILLFAWKPSPYDMMEGILKVGGPYFKNGLSKLWAFWRLIVILWNPADIEVILSSSAHIDKPPEYQFFAPWFGDGILISTGNVWRNHRKIIAPSFHLKVLKTFIPHLNANARILVERLEKEKDKVFDIHNYAVESTVDVLLETVMGVRRKEWNSRTLDYAISAMKLCDFIHQRIFKVWLHLKIINKWFGFKEEEETHLKAVHDLSLKVFKKKIEEYNKGKPNENMDKSFDDINDSETAKKGTYFDQSHGLIDDLDDDIGEKKRLPFLELLIDTAKNGGPITEQQVKNQVDTIMFEGHDTIAAGISFILCIIGCLTDVQEKLYQEIKEIFGDSDRPATFNDTLEMKYLERVILESLRLFPPVPVIARQVHEDVKLPSGYTIPGGTSVVIATYVLHRQEDIYPNPSEFNPDRFLPESISKRHPYAHIPFSAGPRSCVGRKYAMLNLKITLSTIIRNFKIYSDIPVKDFKLQADIILKRADGFSLRVEKRN